MAPLYQKVSADAESESHKSLLSEDSQPWTRPKTPSKWHQVGIYFAYAFVGGILVLLGAIAGITWRGDINLDGLCAPHVSNYSPVMKEVGITYHDQLYNGSLMKENIYRQDASPEVDAAWSALGIDYRPLVVPMDLAEKTGIAHDQVKIKEKYGGGFPGNVEGLHHLHCLNLLRQTLYYNYDYYHAKGEGAFSNNDYVVRRHTTHCLDIIRQQLMCNVDIGVLGQVWIYPDNPEAFVDFNTVHKCRDYDAVRRFAEAHQVPENVPHDYLEPPAEGDRIYEEMP
ncbi:hypothetical protein AWENTII_006691 [Aspergillus wentii]